MSRYVSLGTNRPPCSMVSTTGWRPPGYADGVRIGDDGLDVVILLRKDCERTEHVRLRERRCVALDAAERFRHAFAHFAEQLVFKPRELFGGAHDLVLQLFKFGRNIPFAVCKGLFANIALRRHAYIGFCNFYVIAKYFVIADLQVFNAGRVPFLPLHFGDHGAGVVQQAAEPVHLAVVTVPDQAEFSYGKGAVFSDGGDDMFGKRIQRIERVVERAQVIGPERGERRFNARDIAQRTGRASRSFRPPYYR